MRRLSVLGVDLCLIFLATILALLLRDNVESSAARLAGLTPYVLCTLISATVFLVLFGVDRAVLRMSALSNYAAILGATIGTVVGALVLGFSYNRLEGLARAMPLLQGLSILFMLVGLRVLARLRHGARARPSLLSPPTSDPSASNVLIIGINRLSELYLRSVLELAHDRVKVAGIVGLDARHLGLLIVGHQVLGVIENVSGVLNDLAIHGVVVDRIMVATSFDQLSPGAQEALSAIEGSTGVELDYIDEALGLKPEQTRVTKQRAKPAPRAELPSRDPAIPAKAAPENSTDRSGAFVISADTLHAQAGRAYWRMKRIFDLVLAVTLLVVLAPIWLLVALIVAFDVGLPVAFWQERPGLGGRPFKLYKFRTMARAHDAQGRRVPDDLRLSSIGRLLRRTRLDELPQLLNIVAGDMSFVGPRPLLPVDQSKAHAARLLVRPGLTGWAQVNGGRDIDPSDKAALDIWYVMNASWSRDIEILGRTVPIIVRGERTDVPAIDQAWRDLKRSGAYPVAVGPQ